VILAISVLVGVGAPLAGALTSSQPVARVAGKPITFATYRHWLRIAHHAGQKGSAASQATMSFLIGADWELGEAAARGIHISHAQVVRALRSLERQAFPHPGEFGRFLRSAGETVADVEYRELIDLVSARLGPQAATLPSKWKPMTLCLPAYRVDDCGGTLTA
jgi:hypothetical protein